MSTKITVNGVTYDRVEDMPADVRRQYEQALARFRALSEGGEDAATVVEHELGPLKSTTTVRKQIVVDGAKYEDPAAMPPEARRMFEQAMRAASAGSPSVKRNEIHVSFQLTRGGHGLGFGTRSIPPSQPIEGPLPGVFDGPRTGSSTPSPLFSDTAEARFRLMALFLSACLTGGFLFWLLVGDR